MHDADLYPPGMPQKRAGRLPWTLLLLAVLITGPGVAAIIVNNLLIDVGPVMTPWRTLWEDYSSSPLRLVDGWIWITIVVLTVRSLIKNPAYRVFWRIVGAYSVFVIYLLLLMPPAYGMYRSQMDNVYHWPAEPHDIIGK